MRRRKPCSSDPQFARARTYIQHTGIINECISIRQFFHVAPGNARTAGGEQAILPDQSKWARYGNCRALGGASIRKPFPKATVEAAPVWKFSAMTRVFWLSRTKNRRGNDTEACRILEELLIWTKETLSCLWRQIFCHDFYYELYNA